MIRAMKKSDVEEVAKLSLKTFADGWNADMINGSFKQEGFLGFVYEIDGKIVCACAISHVLGEGEVLFIVTDKDYQRRGYAKEILKTALHELLMQYVKYVFLEVRESNQGAIKLYESLGFLQIAKREKYYGDETAIIMSVDLTSTR